MKLPATFFCLVLFVAANGKEKVYTGSTPANAALVRSFLGIPANDSIDFIRWKLVFDDAYYKLSCNYGIGKPNTNGFINGGKTVELTGRLRKEKNYYYLQNGNKDLKLIEINRYLLQFLDGESNLMIGNAGWSYTLNSMTPLVTNTINFHSSQTVLKDSMLFEGRTPCGVPNIPKSAACYKVKWYIVFYSNEKNGLNTFLIKSTSWRSQGGKRGKWNIVTEKDGRVIYQLNEENGSHLLYLLKLDENILVFTDAKGRLLVGDEDFSYTLNRITK